MKNDQMVLDWQALFLNMPNPVAVLDAQGLILACSRKMEEFLGLGLKDFLGKKCCAIFHGLESAMPPQDCPFTMMLQSGKTEKAEMYLEGRDSHCIAACAPIFDAEGRLSFALHSITEITEHKLVEEALRKGEERLRNVIHGTNAGTWEWNVQSGEASIDERTAEMLGYSLDELSPLDIDSWMRLKHPDDAGPSYEELNRHVRGESEFYSFESRMKHRDGSWIWVHGRGKVIEWDGQGRPLRMFGTHIDATERKRSEAKIKALLAEKELMLKEVHHRIKNNMSTIYSFLALQAGSLGDPASIAALHDAASRVQSMLVLYDILYRRDDFTSVSLALYVPPLVEEIVSNFPNSASVMIKTDIADIVLDIKKAQSLGIILNELITNAMKYAFEGKKGGTIAVSATLTGDRVRFCIADDGAGMPESLGFENSGGFGFTLITGLTEQLGGSVRIERSPGTRVILEFGK